MMDDFLKNLLTPSLRLTPTPQINAPGSRNLPPSSMAEFETPVSDGAALAGRIIAAAQTRECGGPAAPPPSPLAQRILAAGKKARSG